MIYSTLSGLTETVIPELKPVGDKARTLQHLVKPFQYGIQFSHTRHYNKYMPYLRTAGVVSFERIGTEKALVPARASIEHSGFGGLWEINGMTFTVFSEGMDEILAHAINWIEKPTTSENSEEALRDIINKLSIKKRNGDQNAQAFMQFRMFGYEKMFHSDYSTLMKTISDEIRTLSMGGENNPMDYSRALTGFSSQVMVPCSAGFPLYIEIVAPVIYSVKSSISYDSRSLFSGSAKMSFLPVVNTKIYSNVGILSPFTKQFIGAGVELSAHISSPIEVKAEITPRPDVEVTLKFPEQVRKEIEVVHFKVKPYTAVKSLERIGLISKSSGAKVILSGRPEEIIESPWLSKFGISSSLKVVADYKTYDFAYLYRAFKEQGFATFGLMPMTLKSFDAKVKVDPTQSSTTEVKFRLNLSAGRKASVESALELIQPFGGLPIKEYGEEKELHTLCRTLHTSARKIESCIEKGLKSDTTDLVQDMQEIRQICSSPRFPRSEAGECVEALKTCYRAKNVCDQTISPMEETCMGFRKACINEVKTVQHLIHRSTEMGSGYFHGLNVEASLNSRYGSDSVKAFVVSGVKRGGPRVIETFTELVVETPQTTAFEAELKTVTKVPEVLYRWNLDSLLQQSIDMEFDAAFKAGFASSEKVRINIASKLKKSGAQIESVRNSPEYRKCQQEVQKGRTLSTVCIEARNQAASLNKIDLRVQYPEHLFEICPTTLKIANYIKGCFFPYVSMVNDLENEGETSFGRSRSEIRRELVEEAQRESRYIVGEGQGLQTVSLSGEASRIGDVITMGINTPTGSSVLLKNVRIPQVFHGLVPLSVRNGLFDNVIRKVSQQQEPALCTLDQGHISTFDNRTYQYNLNSCEHLLFQDCSQNRPVAVTAMGTDESGNTKIVKAILGENIVEMKKGSGSSVEVFVNGEIKQIGIGEHYSKQDKRQRVALKIFRTRDEVVSVEAPVEGVIVYFNNERLEIIAPQILFNRACGLCGDLNGELSIIHSLPSSTGIEHISFI